ncbi:hypothetical protein MHU86_25459 [Fragilaria crotonensis]|nr:hypothetical protein MHU86_25459 [Fragilaria crotonensis]
MGVRPGTVDGRVPQQTPRRTPRTLSESARDSPAGTHAHEPSRPRHVADAPHLSPARDDPSRNEVGPERYAPALDSPPTDHSVARALSPGDAHDAPTSALADTPRPLPAVQRPDAGIRVSPHRTSRPLLSAHPLAAFSGAHLEGAEFPLREISDSDRLADVRANLARGNHKSARGHEAKLISMLKDEASRGWQLPLPREAALEIKGCEVAPLGMVAQTSIDEKGNSIEKLRLTHDQSFSPSGVAGRSVNERVDTSQLTEARFGKAFSRLMYHISFLRQLWPDEPIWMTKVDCKSAYRRIHLKAATAMKSCTSIDDLLLVALRMTFGGAPNPSQWSDVSEMITDLANDLVRRDDWDPSVYHSPHQHLLDTEGAVDNDKGSVDKMSVFGKADYFAVNYPPYDDLPRFDCYLDDIFGAFNPRDAEKSAAAIRWRSTWSGGLATPSAIAAGAVTKDSSDESTESGGAFSKDSDEKRKQKRSPASPPPFGTDGFAPDNLRKLAMDPCPVPFVPPSTVWLRPSGLTNLRAQSTTPPDDSTPSGFTTETLRRRGPRTYPQQALPLEVIRKVRSWARNETDIAIGQLVVVAFFFAMRSCEYSDVGSRRTTSVIRVDDVRFRQKGQDLQTTDRGQLENADTVSITFRRQKNGDKGATVTQHRNDRQGQTDICPVRVLADLTTRVRSYDCHSRTNPKINAVRTQDSDEPQHISSKSILRQLRMATTLAGEEAWPPGEWHRHSPIRSGAAMAMHLAGVPSETIQMVGRWRSQTFMRYLRIQVPDSTLGVAARMTSRQSFYTIAPDSADERQPENGGNQVDSQSRDGPR